MTSNIKNSDVLLFLNFNESLFDDKFIRKYLVNLNFTYLFFSIGKMVPEESITKLKKSLNKKNCDIIGSNKLTNPVYILT